MSYYSVRARKRIERLVDNYRSDQIRNFAKISDGIAVGSGFVFLMGFTVGYQDSTTPLVILLITLSALGLARVIEAIADLPRSQKRKIKRFLKTYLRISLPWW